MKRSKVVYAIKGFIIKGEVEKAIECGLQFLGNKEFILFASRFNRLEKSNRDGLITFEQYQVGLTRLSKGILELIYEKPEELQPKRRNKLILFLVLTGFFTDWNKVVVVLKYSISAFVGLIGIVIGVTLWNSNTPENVDVIDGDTPTRVSNPNVTKPTPGFRSSNARKVTATSVELYTDFFSIGQDVECWFEDEDKKELYKKTFPINGRDTMHAILTYTWTGLAPNTTYRFRGVAKNGPGMTFGSWRTVTTASK